MSNIDLEIRYAMIGQIAIIYCLIFGAGCVVFMGRPIAWYFAGGWLVSVGVWIFFAIMWLNVR